MFSIVSIQLSMKYTVGYSLKDSIFNTTLNDIIYFLHYFHSIFIQLWMKYIVLITAI